jgi:hypothetical protein
MALLITQALTSLDDGFPDAVLVLGDAQGFWVTVQDHLHAGELSIAIGQDVRRNAIRLEVLLDVWEEDEPAIIRAAVAVVVLRSEFVVKIVDVYLVLRIIKPHHIIHIIVMVSVGDSSVGLRCWHVVYGRCAGSLDRDIELGAILLCVTAVVLVAGCCGVCTRESGAPKQSGVKIQSLGKEKSWMNQANVPTNIQKTEPLGQSFIVLRVGFALAWGGGINISCGRWRRRRNGRLVRSQGGSWRLRPVQHHRYRW